MIFVSIMAVIKKKKNTRQELEAKKRLAYTLFVQNGFDQKIIASITGISQVSISTWKTSDKKAGKDWELDRNELRSGFDNERRRIKAMINRILDYADVRKAPNNITTTAEGDTISKLSASARNLVNELTFDHMSKSYDLLLEHIQKTHGNEKAVEFCEYAHEMMMSKI